jgi:hypothetical protein
MSTHRPAKDAPASVPTVSAIPTVPGESETTSYTVVHSLPVTHVHASFLSARAHAALAPHTLTRTRVTDALLDTLSAHGSTCGTHHTSNTQSAPFHTAAEPAAVKSSSAHSDHSDHSDHSHATTASASVSSFAGGRATRQSERLKTQSVTSGTVELMIVNDYLRYSTYRQQTEILSASTYFILCLCTRVIQNLTPSLCCVCA